VNQYTNHLTWTIISKFAFHLLRWTLRKTLCLSGMNLNTTERRHPQLDLAQWSERLYSTAETVSMMFVEHLTIVLAVYFIFLSILFLPSYWACRVVYFFIS
jgi:hypothetical protein